MHNKRQDTKTCTPQTSAMAYDVYFVYLSSQECVRTGKSQWVVVHYKALLRNKCLFLWRMVKWYEAPCGYLSFPFIAVVFFWYGATLQTCRPKIEMALTMGLRSVNKINKPEHAEVIMGKLALACTADLSRLGCVSSRPPVLSFAPRCESSKGLVPWQSSFEH